MVDLSDFTFEPGVDVAERLKRLADEMMGLINASQSRLAQLPYIDKLTGRFTPAAGAKLAGEACQGVFLIVTDRERIRPVRVGLEIASALSRMYGQQFRLEDSAKLLGSSAGIARIRAGEDAASIASSWRPDEAQWRLTRVKYLLYP